jgi:transcriptional regulator with XRE-family HTH domain
MNVKDNPLRLRRIKAGLSLAELARRVEMQRSSLAAIEAGNTREPTDETLGVLGAHLGQASAAELRAELTAWQARQAPQWSPRQRAVLNQDAETIRTMYASFRAWREDLGLSQPKFAKALGISRSVILEYEAGSRKGGMGDVLMGALLRLGLAADVVVTLAGLPPADREGVEG